MSESPTEYANRVLKMALEAKEPLGLHDAALSKLEKKTETVEKTVDPEPNDPWEMAVKAKCIEQGIPYIAPIIKTTSKPKTLSETIDQMFDAAKGY